MMKYLKGILALLVAVLVHLSAGAQDFPEKSNTLVNDFTGTLTETQKSALEQKLVAFDDSTSTQITVVVMRSVGDYDINDYALELGRRWGVGQKGKNNGIILLVAKGDRKVSIQTGYGVEGALPDAYAKRIIDEDILPQFREEKYYEGIDAGTTQIEKYVKGEFKQDKPRQRQQEPERTPGGGVIAALIFFLLFAFFIRRGGGNNGGQYIGGRGRSSGLGSAILGGIVGSMLNGGRRGSSWGGGGSWGSGSSGGGFGGFGGGSFGGGGASGSW